MSISSDVQAAMEFAAALNERGIDFATLRAAATDGDRLTAIVQTLRSTEPVVVASTARSLRKRTPLNEAISDMKITNRLHIEGITYLEELVVLTENELLSVRIIGVTSVLKVRRALGKVGLRLRDIGESKSAVLAQLYGDASRAPLKIIFFNDWKVYRKLRDERITTTGELLACSRADLLALKRTSRIPQYDDKGNVRVTVAVFFTSEVHSIEEILKTAGLALREE